MNDIPAKQNERRQLQLLRAQRVLYSSSKNWFNSRTILALIFATFGPAFTSFNSDLAAYAAVVIVFYLLLDNFFLKRREAAARRNAAKVQELFDTTVLSLQWNTVVAGGRPEEEVISKALNSKSRRAGEGLENWYAVDVGKVDLALARLLCQRSSAWWDTTLRSAFVSGLVTIAVILTLISIGFCVWLRLPVDQVAINLLWLYPLIELVVKQILKNHDASVAITELKTGLESEIQMWMQGSGEDKPEVARAFQDQLYSYRQHCPMIPDWFYWLHRNRQESQMQFSVSARVEEYLSR